MWVTTLYCAPSARSQTSKGRGREEAACIQSLGPLGIQEGSSPALVREVGRQVAACCPSYAITREELARRGLDLDSKEVYGIGKYAGAAALTYRRRLLERYRAGRLAAGPEGAGKRLGVFVDGRRTKIPTATRRQQGRGKHKTQRGGLYRTDWREPKLLIVVELDEQGRMVPGTKAVLDGTFGGPDELMELLAMYLHLFGAVSAELVSLGADGAPWVWERWDWVSQKRVGLESESGDQDLGLVSCRASPPVWPWNTWSGYPDVRRRVFKKLRKWLKQGNWSEVVLELAKRAKDVPADQAVWTELSYLERHGEQGHLDYARFRRRGSALGAAVPSESADHSPGHQLTAQRQQHQLVRSECGRHAGVALSGAEQPLGRHLRPHQRQLGQRPSLGLDLPLPRHANPAEGEHPHRTAQATTLNPILHLRYSCLTAFWEGALGGYDQSAAIWLGPTAQTTVELRHPQVIESVAWHPTGKLLATGCPEGVRVWRTASRNPVHVLQPGGLREGERFAIGTGDLSVNGRRTVVPELGPKGRVWVWDVTKDDSEALPGPPPQVGGVSVAKFTPDAQLLLLGQPTGNLILWDLAASNERWKLPLVHGPDNSEYVRILQFSSDGHRWAAADKGGRVHIGRTETNKIEHSMSVPHMYAFAMNFSKDASRLVIGWANTASELATHSGSLTWWDTATGTEIGPTRTLNYLPTDLAVSPDGKALVVCGLDRRVTVWDMESHESIKQEVLLNGSAGIVAFADEGNTLLTVRKDGAIQFWHWPTCLPVGNTLLVDRHYRGDG